jgi:acetylornithine deacetylase/succinyl-diaminopimelate desuccinylase-like protein
LLVNVKIVFEGMEEYGSEGIFDLSPANPRPHQARVAGPRGSTDAPFFFCIIDAVWLGKRKPCLTYGLRGIAYFALSVRKHVEERFAHRVRYISFSLCHAAGVSEYDRAV